MVLEAIMSVKDAIRKPWHVLLFSAAISVIALVVSFIFHTANSGLLTVFLITIISAPFMLGLLRYEEKKEEGRIKNAGLLQRMNPVAAFYRQGQTFLVYSAFFVGITLAMLLIFFFLPSDFVNGVFNDQIDQIGKISSIIGAATSQTGFGQILANNLIVMATAFIFALLFGLGAVFILTWNASVLAAAIGIVAKGSGLPAALAQFLPHGIFEIAGYVIAGIAGGIISAAVSKRGKRGITPVVGDMLVLMVLSAFLIFLAACIESA